MKGTAYPIWHIGGISIDLNAIYEAIGQYIFGYFAVIIAHLRVDQRILTRWLVKNLYTESSAYASRIEKAIIYFHILLQYENFKRNHLNFFQWENIEINDGYVYDKID